MCRCKKIKINKNKNVDARYIIKYWSILKELLNDWVQSSHMTPKLGSIAPKRKIH